MKQNVTVKTPPLFSLASVSNETGDISGEHGEELQQCVSCIKSTQKNEI
jgi:hypothetical protein